MADSLHKLLGEIDTGAVPSEVAPLVKALLEGTVKQCLIIFETHDRAFCHAYPIIDDTASRLGMLGAIESVKRDYMRSEVDSRVRYQHAKPDSEDDDE